MAALSDFLLYVRPEAPECPEIQLKNAALRAGIDFCRQTRLVTKSFDLATVVGQSAYDITAKLDAETEADTALFVKRPGMVDPLDPSNARDFELHGWDDPLRTGDPMLYYLTGNTLVLGPVPVSIETLKVKVVVVPTLTATGLPAPLSKHAETIGYGAKAILMAMRNKPWTDPEGAGLNAGLFQAEIDKEKLRIARGNAVTKLRVKPSFF